MSIIRNKIFIYFLVLLLTGCGGQNSDTNDSSENAQAEEVTSSSNTIDLTNQTLNGSSSTRQSSVTRLQPSSLSISSTADFLFPQDSGPITGNLTFQVKVLDEVSMSGIELSFAGQEGRLALCEGNCGTDFSKTIIGLNPRLSGQQPGQLELEIWVTNSAAESTIAGRHVLEWQPETVSGVTVNRTNSLIEVNWQENANIKRYNVYLATEAGVDPSSVSMLQDGQQFLAIEATSIQIPDTFPDKPFQLLVTGVDGSGESAYSDLVEIPSVDGKAFGGPIAVNDAFSGIEDGEIQGNVLDNDTDTNNLQLTASISEANQPRNGSIEMSENGNFVYLPAPNFFGSDSFTYQVVNSDGHMAEATVDFIITSVNDAPIATNDAFDIPESGILEVGVDGLLGNDFDVDGDSLSVVLQAVNEPDRGELELNEDGSFVFVITPLFTGEVTFVYQIADGNGGAAEATVRLIGQAENLTPMAVNDSYTMAEDGVLNILSSSQGLLSNDSDPNFDSISVRVGSIVGPENGQLVISTDGTFRYVPDANFYGIDSFLYSIEDEAGLTSSAAVEIMVSSQPDIPVAMSDSYSVNTGESLVIDASQGLTENDYDLDGDNLSVDLGSVTSVSNGTLEVFVDGGFVYQSVLGFAGTDSFTYSVTNSAGLSASSTVQIDVIQPNRAPSALSDAFSVNEDESLSVIAGSELNILSNDFDLDNDELTVLDQAVSAPTNGTLTLRADGSFDYTPNTDFNGIDSFTYQISDPDGETAIGTVTINVVSVNDVPVAVADTVTVNEDTALTVTVLSANNVLSNDTDIENHTLTVNTTPVTGPSNGILTLNADGSYVYTPNQDYFGGDSFVYEISDGQGGTSQSTVSITVNSINDSPVASNDSLSVDEDNTLTVLVSDGNNLLANDTDVEGDSLTVSVSPVTAPSNGSLSLNADGSYTYTPTANFFGSDSFTYQVVDGNGGSDTATVQLTVNPINDAPVASSESYVLNEDTPLTIAAADSDNLLANDSDIDNDELSVDVELTMGPSNGSLELDSNGSFIYTPNQDFFGEDSFLYKVTDGNATSGAAAVTLTINPVEDAPVANQDVYIMAEEETLTVSGLAINNLLANDIDVDGDALTVALLPDTDVMNGTLTLSNDGGFVYTPNENFFGEDSFNYRISDPSGNSASTGVTITVTNRVDNPIALEDTYVTASNIQLNIGLNRGLLSNDIDPDKTEMVVDIENTSEPSNGTLSVNADGSFTYLSNPEFTGLDSFNYIVLNGSGLSASGQVNISVIDTNSPPIASSDVYQVNEDTTLEIHHNETNNLLINDSDVDLQVLTVNSSPITAPVNGQLTLDNSGGFVYVPNENFNGEDSFSYEINDGNEGKDTATVTITVNAINDVPVTVNDNYSLAEDDVLTITVNDLNHLLSNDSDVEGDILSIALSPNQTPKHGTVELATDGSFEYVPNLNFNGTDSFKYEVTDGNGGSAIGTVFLTILPVNDAPTASDDSFSLLEDGVLTVDSADENNLLSNDFDLDNDSISVESLAVSGPNFGELELNADGSFVYTPNQNFFGSDSFEYQISDGKGGFSTAVATITVNSINDSPVASNDSISVDEDNTLTVLVSDGNNLLANDTDVEGDSLTVSVSPVAAPSNGSLSLNADGSFTYAPTANFFGSDSFTYQVFDGNGGSDTATVQLTVNPINDAPVAVADTVTVNEDTSLTVTVLSANNVLSNDTDIENDALTVNTTPVTGPSNGILTLNADGSYVYTPNQDFFGSDSFVYQINDGQGGTSQSTVSITVNSVNDNPVGTNDSLTVDEDTTLTVLVSAGNNLLANDSDVDGDTLTINPSPVSGPSNGSLTLNADGSFDYTPSLNFNGSDSFTYEVLDGNGGSSNATAQLTINPINDAPVAVADTVTVNEDTALTVTVLSANNVLSNDTDIENDALTVNTTPVTGPSNGILTLNADGSYVYTPNQDFFGSDSFVYQINDGQGGTSQSTVSITVNSVNDNPVGTNDSLTVDEDTTLTVLVSAGNNLLANDTDVDGDTLTINPSPVSGPSNGSLTLNADGSFDYTPSLNFNGSDSFTYEVLDGNGGSSNATAQLTINPINDAPVAVADTVTVNEDTALTVTVLSANNVLSNDTDIENDALTVNTTPVTGPSNGILTLNADGSYVYTPNQDYFGSDSFVYQINDGQGGLSQSTVSITVNSINDSPVASNDSISVDEDNTLTVLVSDGNNLLANDTDVEGDSLTVSVSPVAAPSNGSLSLNADGSYTYTPTANFFGSDSFTYQVVDGNGGSDTATVQLTVNPINDAPVASDYTFNADEDKQGTYVVGVITATDVEGDSLTFSIYGADAGLFNLVPVSGDQNSVELTLNDNDSLNFEVDTLHSVSIDIDDDGSPTSETATITVTVNVNDVLEPQVPTKDETFGAPVTGSFDFSTLSVSAEFNDVVESGDKTYFVGAIDNIDKDIYIESYGIDGDLNSVFGNSGKLTIDTGYHEVAQALTINNNDIFVAFERTYENESEVCVIKLDETGTIDNGSGDNDSGIKCLKLSGKARVYDLEYDSGKVYLVGDVYKDNQYDSLFIKFNDGSLITEDSTPLIVDISGANKDDHAKAIKHFEADNFLISGSTISANGDYDSYVRYVDKYGLNLSEFNTGQTLVLDLSSINKDDELISIGGEKQGNFTAYLGGYAEHNNATADATIVSIFKSGLLNTSFGVNGVATFDIDGDSGTGTGDSEFVGVVLDEETERLKVTGNLNDGSGVTAFVSRHNATTGNITTGFGTNGVSLVGSMTGESFATAMALDTDGRIWVSGANEASDDSAFAAAFNNSGTVYSCFPNSFIVCLQNGVERIDLTGRSQQDNVIKVLKLTNGTHAGKYILLSLVSSELGGEGMVMSRFNSDGTLDTSLDNDGHVQLPFDEFVDPKQVFELANGNLTVIGSYDTGQNVYGFVAQYNQQGLPIDSFATNGVFRSETLSSENASFLYGMLDSNSKLIISGYAYISGTKTGALLRLTPGGELDDALDSYDGATSVFGTTGVVYTDTNDHVTKVAEDSSGNYVTATENTAVSYLVKVRRHSSSGNLDGTFGSAGLYSYDAGANMYPNIRALLIDGSDNTFVVTSIDATQLNQKSAIIHKLDATGNLDTSFSTDGIADVTLSSENDSYVHSANFDGEGNILLSGGGDVSAIYKGAIGRVTATGDMDVWLGPNSEGFAIPSTCIGEEQYVSLVANSAKEVIVGVKCNASGTNDVSLLKFDLVEP